MATTERTAKTVAELREEAKEARASAYIGLPKRVPHPDPATEAWLSFCDRQSLMIAKASGSNFDAPSPMEEAGATILVAVTNRLSGKLAELLEVALDRATGWVKLFKGFKNPFTRIADPPAKPVGESEVSSE